MSLDLFCGAGGYPVQGGKVSRYRQVGDAIPRGLARAALSSLGAS